MTVTIQQSRWVDLRPGDASFRLNGDVTVTDRAFIEITGRCPLTYVNIIAMAIEQNWIQPVAAVPRTDPTLIWETLKQ